MIRTAPDASGWQYAAGTWPNGAAASGDTRCNRTMQRFGHSFA
ncbi:hypothetical protein [Burkholderia seminalis]|nr:hypothetical protein [Burkholderia seminalis]